MKAELHGTAPKAKPQNQSDQKMPSPLSSPWCRASAPGPWQVLTPPSLKRPLCQVLSHAATASSATTVETVGFPSPFTPRAPESSSVHICLAGGAQVTCLFFSCRKNWASRYLNFSPLWREAILPHLTLICEMVNWPNTEQSSGSREPNGGKVFCRCHVVMSRSFNCWCFQITDQLPTPIMVEKLTSILLVHVAGTNQGFLIYLYYRSVRIK